MIAWRVCKVRHPPYDGTGAALVGARWSSPGRHVVYAADSFAGALLEIVVHASTPRTLPGPHHAVRIEVPDALVEVFDETTDPAWHERGSPSALAFGDAWHAGRRSAALSVPAVPARPIGRTLLIDPAHPDAGRIVVSDPFPVPWDDRLF
jgi:RES domain-containing protein